MNEIILSLIINGIMVVLLTMTVVYCFKLNTRIRILQDSKSEFSQLITRFDETTQRAQASIQELQTISAKVNEQLSARLDKANFLADDLAFMIEKGGKIADQMENRFAGQRVEAATPVTPARPERRESRVAGAGTADLPSARPGRREPMLSSEKATDTGAEDRKRSLESVLDKVSGRRGGGDGAGAKPGIGRPTARLRSKAERELYDALKSGE